MPRGRKPGSKNKTTKPAMKKEKTAKAVEKKPQPKQPDYKTGKAVNKEGSVVIEQDMDKDASSNKGKSVVIRGGKAMLVNDDEETGE